MSTQKQTDFERIAKAISYIADNFKMQPTLEQLAGQAGLSPFHFQRLFTKWAGTSPKKFTQYLSLEYAKKIVREDKTSLLKVARQTGLSGSSRLHDLFVTIEGMTPGEYKNGGVDLDIHYTFANNLFGRVLIASTLKGVCYLAFADSQTKALRELRDLFPRARLHNKNDAHQKMIINAFKHWGRKSTRIKLHLKGTDFQLRVWKALLTIPPGKLSTYGAIAERIDQPQASRAVGSAVGQNPVSLLIPCHRVIRSTGVFGQYHWGSARKTAMIGWEATRAQSKSVNK